MSSELDDITEVCDSCGALGGKYPSTGGINFCHKCAHDHGLTHKHPDIDDTMHFHEAIASKEEIKVHLEAIEELKDIEEIPLSFQEKIKPMVASIRNTLERIEMHAEPGEGEPDYDTIDSMTDLLESSLGDIRELLSDIEEPAV